MRFVKRTGLVFLWLLIPSSITVSLKMFAHIILGGLPTILLYLPFVYLVRKTARGDFDGGSKYTEAATASSPAPEPSPDICPEPQPEPEPELPHVPEPQSEPLPAPEPEPVPEAPSVIVSPEKGPKFCDNCGTECENWVKFCPVCGCKTFSVWIKKPLQVTSDPELLKAADKKAHRYMFKKRLPLILTSILALALLSLCVVLWAGLREAEKTNQLYSEQIRALSDDISAKAAMIVDLNSQITSKNEEIHSYITKLREERETAEAHERKIQLIEAQIVIVPEGDEHFHSLECVDARLAMILEEPYSAYTVPDCLSRGFTPHDCWHK